MDFMPLRLNSSSLTCSICALTAIILQLVAMECQKLHMVDLPILSFNTSCKIPLVSGIDFTIRFCYRTFLFISDDLASFHTWTDTRKVYISPIQNSYTKHTEWQAVGLFSYGLYRTIDSFTKRHKLVHNGRFPKSEDRKYCMVAKIP